MSHFRYDPSKKKKRSKEEIKDLEVESAKSASQGAIIFNFFAQLTWLFLIFFDSRSPFISENYEYFDPAQVDPAQTFTPDTPPPGLVQSFLGSYEWDLLLPYLFTMILYNVTHIRVWGSDAGYLPRLSANEFKKEPAEDSGELIREEDGLKLRWCNDCKHVQPLRTKHCDKCGCCVRKYDHHCFWMGGCVGEFNHREFTYVLMTATIYVGWTAVLSGAFLSFSITKSIAENITDNMISLPLFFIAWGILVFAVSLLGCHLYLAATGQTMWEMMSRKKISYLKDLKGNHRPFDLGGCFWTLKDFYLGERDFENGKVWLLSERHPGNCLDCII